MKYLFAIITIVLLISCADKPERVNNEKTTINQKAVEHIDEDVFIDGSGQIYSGLITVLQKEYNAENNYNYYNSEIAYSNSKSAFTQAINYYHENLYQQAIYSYIDACKSYTSVLFYYHLGLCLMDAKEYELAKASFEKAISLFENDVYYPNHSDYYYDDLFTYDENGIKRELYFSYYNIACIESMQNNIDSSYKYLCESLYHGYPYINHIRQDEDFYNLFKDKNRLQSIENIYNAGSQNRLVGRRFDMDIYSGFVQLIDFHSESRLEEVMYYQGGRNDDKAEYEIKNYMVFSNVLSSSSYAGGFKYIRQFEGLDQSGKNFKELTEDEMLEYDERYKQY
jgi:tetratricopeptide (TPR) repeat protein